MTTTPSPSAPQEVPKEPCTLNDCPFGLFDFNGTLGFKSEYGRNNGQCDAYCVDSGEYFWGGADGDTVKRGNLMVRPIDHTRLTAATEEAERLRGEVAERDRRLEEQHKLYCEETKRHNETWAKIHAATAHLNKEFKKLPEDLVEAVKEVTFRCAMLELGRDTLRQQLATSQAMRPDNLRAKYVVLLHQGLEVPVLLPLNAGMAHAELAKVGHAIAAGECELHTLGAGNLGFTCGGESLSLKLKSRGAKDQALLEFHYLQGGIR